LNGPGFGGSANATFSDWQKTWADSRGWILVKLDGRGNTFYDGVGENDMLKVLTALKAEYSVDEDRIYFEGASMGATGTFRQGFRHPDLFAAIAGVDGWGYYPLWHEHWYAPADDPDAVAECHVPLLMAGCPYHLAENVRNLPVWLIVDSGDTTVEPDNGRMVHQRLQQLGYSHSYTENSGGHCASYNLANIYPYFEGKSRTAAPNRVTQASYLIRQGESYWVTMNRLRHSATYSALDASISGSDVQVSTENVLSYTLELDESPLAAQESVTVHHDGALVYAGPPVELTVFATISTMDNSITGWSTVDTLPAALHKTAAVEGPFGHAFESPFLVVYGTQGGQMQRDRGEADTFCGDWNSWMKASISSIPDSSVTQSQRQNFNLILFGTAESNSITGSIAPGLPFSVTEETIQCNGEAYDGNEYGLFAIYPNPDYPSRYVVICHGQIQGATEKKMESLPWYWPDFVVFNTTSTPPLSVQPPSRYLAGVFADAGFFSQYWTTPDQDHDGDGLPDSLDTDDDGDGLSDEIELQFGSDPMEADSDGDGVTDSAEIDWNIDTDSDGLINAADPDSDGDGFTDYMESVYGTSPLLPVEYPQVLRINFQPAASTAPGGYLKDSNLSYSTGRAYGWR
jgi:predicted esterase